MKEIPAALLDRPFSRAQAAAVGVSSRMLDGARFVRIFKTVWRLADHVMTDDDFLTAVRLALPTTACTTGITRLRELGLDYGPKRPVHFVVEGELHRAMLDVFLHRTRKLAPATDGRVSPAAAYIAYCATARVVDAIKVGDGLLHGGHTTTDEICSVAAAAPWRDGAAEATWICQHLDERSASLMESETRAVLTFAGLAPDRVNAPVPTPTGRTITPDLVYLDPLAAVEYEGEQHQLDRTQYTSDIDRYSALREAKVPYLQVTKESLRQARHLVRRVHRMLVAAGYVGPAPVFEQRWRSLFGTVRAAAAAARAR
jgi:hypothetical protein